MVVLPELGIVIVLEVQTMRVVFHWFGVSYIALTWDIMASSSYELDIRP